MLGMPDYSLVAFTATLKPSMIASELQAIADALKIPCMGRICNDVSRETSFYPTKGCF